MNIPFKVYKVGGCVRDFILGRPVEDIDYVVLGATPEKMLNLGFKTVGNDFPVFLHPDTGEEYALARTERKNGVGYLGFTVHADESVTLEEDLARRDFTMNAMAMSDEGTIIDPYNGLNDIQANLIRHVSEAFADDPVRVLRGARFAARYNFNIAPETLELMKKLQVNGELKHLTKERVVMEFNKTFKYTNASKMFKILNQVNAMDDIYPNLLGFKNDEINNILDDMSLSTDDKWGTVLHKCNLNKEQIIKTVQEFKIPVGAQALSLGLLKLKEVNILNPTPAEMLKTWQDLDFRRKQDLALNIINLKTKIDSLPDATLLWRKIHEALSSISEKDIAATCVDKRKIQETIMEHRLQICQSILSPMELTI